MKVKIGHYMHSDNGLYLEIVPETQEEQSILEAMWRHGALATSAAPEAKHLRGNACIIRAFGRQPASEK